MVQVVAIYKYICSSADKDSVLFSCYIRNTQKQSPTSN